ncbi:L-lactate dehydrogenase [Feifania hominis]|uniref:L-lactate dehydrogenase n=1 Tax=Feifania hominis TaxID=2763660 RepID=A0A926DBX1_9FIRM|nr:L-lactate dehydrogenase [Feifania hominis]MBC8535258.1 L-lactate dehydrogenase [Feifania hominis]
MVNLQKCAIIGCGQVGATTAFTLMKSGLFSELILIDLDPEKADGEAMDLNHCLPFLKPAQIRAGGYDDLADAALVIITAGANQKPDESRTDLVGRNVAIMRQIVPEIVSRNRECILLVVSNPVDILTQAVLKLSGFPAQRVIGSGTVLDTARLKYLLGRRLHVDSRNVHAFVIGEHGDSELAVWSSANISGVDIGDYCRVCCASESAKTLHPIFDEVKNSAYAIIEKKGATYYAISLAVLRICEAIIRDEESILTVSTHCQGHYGLDGLCIGLPCVVGREGVLQILDISLDGHERQGLERSAALLRELIRQQHLD